MVDVASLDDVISTTYTAISGPPGGQDWEAWRTLFHPAGRLVRTRADEAGRPIAFPFPVEEFEANGRNILADISIYEVEKRREVIRFGNIAQVFSSYDIFSDAKHDRFVKSGLNMIQLYHDGQRWWIMHALWDEGRAGVTIPTDIFD